jgi:hypothetical protein
MMSGKDMGYLKKKCKQHSIKKTVHRAVHDKKSYSRQDSDQLSALAAVFFSFS